MKNELEVLPGDARIEKKAYTGQGREINWEIPINTKCAMLNA
jgi:hypothetical protein